MTRAQVFQYIKEAYGTQPDYPWSKFPSYAVFRHSHNQKWYGLIASVPGVKLGLRDEEKVDILNVKCDPEWGHLLRQQEGILPAYHMSKEHWITVLLGSVPLETMVLELLDASYRLTK